METINVLVNGTKIEVPKNKNLKEVIEYLPIKKDIPFALALNNEFIPKGNYSDKTVKEEDQIEVVTPHPGGWYVGDWE